MHLKDRYYINADTFLENVSFDETQMKLWKSMSQHSQFYDQRYG